MFGYVRPLLGQLPNEEKKHYQAAYCGLCRSIGRRYGLLPRLFLNYDFTFLAMLLAEPEEKPELRCCRCMACPLKKRVSWEGDAGLDCAADESVILTYWKLLDSVRDNGFWKGLPARIAALLLLIAYRKAARRRPVFDHTVRQCLKDLQMLEKENSASLDRTADTFARILQAAVPEIGSPPRIRALRQLLYHVGRWIYLVDAWDDLDADQAKQDYNPILTRYGRHAPGYAADVRDTMHVSLGVAFTACGLLYFGIWSYLINHILTDGLPTMEEAVFSGQWKNRKKGLGKFKI